jgi:hypothetical protein
LWYDDDPGRDLTEKIARAAHRYQQKFGVAPDVCYVHPSTLGDNGKVRMVAGVSVMSKPTVLRHHFWLVRERPVQQRRAMKSKK